METPRRTGLGAQELVAAVAIGGVRRRLFSPAGTDQVAVAIRAMPVPIQDTPHIPQAADYFQRLHQDDEANDNVFQENPAIPERDGTENAQRGSSMEPKVEPAARKRSAPKKRRRRVVSPGISIRTCLLKVVKYSKDFINKAEKNAGELSRQLVCATTKKFGWNKIVERGHSLMYKMTKVSNSRGLSVENQRIYTKLENCIIRLQEVVVKYEYELEIERKELKRARGQGSRKRSCCRVCAKATGG